MPRPHQVPAKIKQVLYGCVRSQKPLRLTHRFESAHTSLSTSGPLFYQSEAVNLSVPGYPLALKR